MRIIQIVALMSFWFVTSASAQTIDDVIVQNDQFVAGQPVTDYVNTWWQWAYSMPQEQSPVRDYTGKNCHVAQSGDVWFLAGGYGSSTINRVCDIPANKYLFFPIINMLYHPRYPGSMDCDTAKTKAALNNDTLADIYVELDGSPSSNPASTRIASTECFDLLARIPREYEPPYVGPSATDGFWLMLKPLSKGKHILKFQAGYNRENGAFGKSYQDIVYELNVQ